MRILSRTLIALLLGGLALLASVGCVQRRLLYFPSHRVGGNAAAQPGLVPWSVGGEYTGYARPVELPRKVWLLLHGNAGQAADRGYVLPHLNPQDALFVLEYPGYGERDGSPSKAAFDAAALKAYEWLVATYGDDRLIVLGESLGSGPACELAHAKQPPKHIVLIVPFDVLEDVAKEKFSWLPVGLIMLDRWDNVKALHDYTGKLDIFGATYDQVIPVHHARNLAAAHPEAAYHEFNGDHGWARSRDIDLSQL